MSQQQRSTTREEVGAWAKRCYFAGRTVMDATLRPHGLGSVQWYVLHRLVTVGPTIQRDLGRLLEIERATMSGIVATLVRKGLDRKSVVSGKSVSGRVDLGGGR